MADNKKLFDERLKRVDDALALKEPDRVPCIPMYTTFPFLWAGYTMAEVLYDQTKAQDAIKRYLAHFEPDMDAGYGAAFAGMGPVLEKFDPVWLEWAGKPNSRIPDNSIHQYLEKAYMEDGEYEEFNTDMSGWITRRYLPRSTNSLKALAGVDVRGGTGYGFGALSMQFASPEVQQAYKTLGEVGQMAGAYYGQLAADLAETTEMGYPNQTAATITTAFDCVSDCLRGTLPASLDMMADPDSLKAAIEQFHPVTLASGIGQAAYSTGRFVFIPLHKGMDGFMSDEQYRTFYWDTLLRLVNGLIDAGLTPWIYGEGHYDSRIECLMDTPKGKCWIHLQDTDMARAKKLLGDVACLSGGFRSDVLARGTVEQTIEQVKQNMDILAPGGGYIFDLSDAMDDCKPENVEAMFETVKEYGKY